ncbi:MAG: ATP-binding cassette domain-containing protein [Bacilli bacterium]|nr:ATP-binding cassette domain-containing protein [Bacilli bacterium]
MIEVSHVYKEFTKKIDKKKKIKFYADNDITFKVDDGMIFGIIGPNGAGKTTMLRMLSGIMEPSKGSILIDKKSYKDKGIEIKKNLAFLSGNTKLYKDISPVELLRMCGEYYDVEKDVLDKRIEVIVDRFDMKSFAHQKIENLSTGQYQRVSIARCLVHDPKYYILDEATSGLDVISGKVIIDFIKEEKAKGKCIIYSTHYMEEATSICDKILMMNKGKVLIEGTVKEIKKKSGKDNLRDAFFELTRRDNDG